MKKLYKTSSKKGFTLLEVMLAVAIMAITSTMIMQGFIALMNCSRNTTIYSRVGGAHYNELITKIAQSSATPASSRDYTGGSKATLSYSGIKTGIYVWRLGNSTETVNINSATGNQREADINTTVVDNRSAFFYVPTNSSDSMECPRHHVGYFAYCYFIGGPENTDWDSPDFRCLYPMSDPNFDDDNHRYCFQFGEGGGEGEGAGGEAGGEGA